MNDLNALEIKMTEQKKDIEYIKITVNEIKKSMNGFQEQCNKKFAAKWSENAMAVVIAVMGTSVLGALMFLVIK